MSGEQYNEDYYTNYNSESGTEYAHGQGWEEVFGNYADRIVKEIHPERTLDVGCAIGFFVEALRDREVEAYGIDISEYAIANVREDIRPFCKVQSALLPINEKYDLITCIEVLEHLDSQDISLAIKRMCEATEDIIFSSTPFEYEEKTHISVHPTEFWVEQFAYNGFYHDIQYDCSYISIQAMRFKRVKKDTIELIRDYEKVLFQKHQEVTAIRHQLQLSDDNVQIYKDAYQKHVDMINQELNPKIQELSQQIVESQKEFNDQVAKINQDKKDEFNKELARLQEEAELKYQELEEKYKSVLSHEVKQRKNFEEQYYLSQDEHEALRLCQIELSQVTSSLQALQAAERNFFNLYSNTTLQGLFRQHMKRKSDTKKLLAMGKEFWRPVFDPVYYAEHNDDVSRVYGTDSKKLLKHFVCFGMDEGRRGNEEFNVDVYMRCNPDVVRQWQFDRRAYYLHYISDGKSEGRRASE